MTVITQYDLKRHVGHEIVVMLYNEGNVDEETTVECETCHEILYSEFKYCLECKRRLDEYGKCPSGCDGK